MARLRYVRLAYNSGRGSFSSRVVISESKLGNVKRERAPRVRKIRPRAERADKAPHAPGKRDGAQIDSMGWAKSRAGAPPGRLLTRPFQIRLERHQEAGRLAAGDHAVIEGQRETGACRRYPDGASALVSLTPESLFVAMT